jgi:hypothetical protein
MRPVLIVALLAASLLSGCNGEKTNTNSNTSNANAGLPPPEVKPIKPTDAVDPNFKPCNPYYPLLPGSEVKYTLKYSSGLFADITAVVDSVNEGGRQTFVETTQIVDSGGGLEKLERTVRKYICDAERVQLVYEKGSNRAGQIANDFESNFTGPSVLMVDPASLQRKGTTWSYSFKQVFHVAGQPPIAPDETSTVGFQTMGEEEVVVGAGKFKAVKVARKVKDREGIDYFVKGLGLVKRVGWDGTSWELREYSGLKPLD